MAVGGTSAARAFMPYLWTSSPETDEKSFFEREASIAGARAIAGADEVGRGPLAGPIVAAAVILGERVEGIDDSKRLTPAEREALHAQLTSGAHAFSVAIVSWERIDHVGIQV